MNSKKNSFVMNAKSFLYHLIRGNIIIFIAVMISLMILKIMNYDIDFKSFFTYKYMYNTIIGGSLFGIAAWWMKTYGSESEKKK